MKLLTIITTPILLPHWSQDLFLIIPRIVCGYLLAFNFGAAKFGMPWSPADNNLGLFEVAFWFPNDVAEYGGIFAIAPAFFAWMGAFSEAVGGVFLLFGFYQAMALYQNYYPEYNLFLFQHLTLLLKIQFAYHIAQ